MKLLTTEEEAQVGEMIAMTLGISKRVDGRYLLGDRFVTSNGVYNALKEVMQELREKEVL